MKLEQPALSDFLIEKGNFFEWLYTIVAGAMVHADIETKGITGSERILYITKTHPKYKLDMQNRRKAQ